MLSAPLFPLFYRKQGASEASVFSVIQHARESVPQIPASLFVSTELSPLQFLALCLWLSIHCLFYPHWKASVSVCKTQQKCHSQTVHCTCVLFVLKWLPCMVQQSKSFLRKVYTKISDTFLLNPVFSDLNLMGL